MFIDCVECKGGVHILVYTKRGGLVEGAGFLHLVSGYMSPRFCVLQLMPRTAPVSIRKTLMQTACKIAREKGYGSLLYVPPESRAKLRRRSGEVGTRRLAFEFLPCLYEGIARRVQ